ncbi:MAG: tetratricopeptide repeat protein [Nitrospinae bacterium]|nr:tetratricopeptide repeat protein [Nitrospinota bacterium]
MENNSDVTIESKNIFLICDSLSTIEKLKNSLDILRDNMESVLKFNNIDSAIKRIDHFISNNKEIHLIITDVRFQSSETNVIALINKLEDYKSFWNTPILIFTNHKERELLRNISRAFVHLPFRIVFTENNNDYIASVFHELIKFKIKNQKFLDLETKIFSIMEMGNRNLLKPAMESIVSAHKKDPKICTYSKTQLLTGQLFTAFWKSSNAKLESLTEKLEEVKIDSLDYKVIIEQIEHESEINKKMLNKAKDSLRKSFEARPSYWKANEALYKLHMELNEIEESKHYLNRLISLFPAEATYFLKMGKLYELSNNYRESIEYFLESASKALNSGVSNLKKEDLMEIIDASLYTGTKIMRQINVTELNTDNEGEFETELMLKDLRKNNAQIRATLERMNKQFPHDSNYLNKIAITYRRTGEYDVAEGFYKKAIKEDSENPIIRINFAMCLACNNLFEQASKMIETASRYQINEEEREIYDKARNLINKKDIVGIRKIMI